MLKSIFKPINRINTPINHSYSTRRGVRFTNKAISALATDDTGKHPPKNKIAKLVDNTDANGVSYPQFFVPNENPTDCTTEMQQHASDIQDEPKTTAYVQQHHDK